MSSFTTATSNGVRGYKKEVYEPPKWALCLKDIPKSCIKVGQLPTPVNDWKLQNVPSDFRILIKRDDLSSGPLSGNKVRKLEFIFAEALRRGCKHVMTCGGVQSNHCRATAVLAAEMGLKCHLFLRTNIKHTQQASTHGNMFFNRISGADIYFLPHHSPYETTILPRMKIVAENIKNETGEESYLLPVGGSDAVGFYGYLEAYRELMDQGITDHVTDIVFTCGSGGTAEGLAAANYLANGKKIRVHGIAVSDDASFFHNHANMIFEQIGLDVKSEEILDVIDGHKGTGYGIAQEEDYKFITEVGSTTGIILDPVYTAKAVRGLVYELNNNPQRFKGNKILFIHTGGMFGAMDGSMEDAFTKYQTGNHYMWTDINQIPK